MMVGFSGVLVLKLPSRPFQQASRCRRPQGIGRVQVEPLGGGNGRMAQEIWFTVAVEAPPSINCVPVEERAFFGTRSLPAKPRYPKVEVACKKPVEKPASESTKLEQRGSLWANNRWKFKPYQAKPTTADLKKLNDQELLDRLESIPSLSSYVKFIMAEAGRRPKIYEQLARLAIQHSTEHLGATI